jgi:putative membrane protein
MVAAGAAICAIAALIHVYIFVLESLRWTSPTTRAVFGTTAEQAEATRELAYNQGFYNLFLAVEIAAGVVVLAVGDEAIGATLVLAGAASMVAAGLVLLASSPDKASAALKQLVPPLVGIALLVVGLVA